VRDQCLSAQQESQVLGCTPRQVPRLASKGVLTVHCLFGCDPRYLPADLECLADSATEVARCQFTPGTTLTLTNRPNDPR
jgi:hypothetical protein